MKKIILFTVMAMLCLNFWAKAQSAVKPLSIGDAIPDIALRNVLNYKDSTIQFSNFKGKAIILDFWATWCTGCIKGFPQLDGLQKKYADQLQIVLMNISSRDTKSIISVFLNKQKETIPSFSIPVAMVDIKLKQLFPFHVLPHYIWVSKTGQIKAITGSEELSQNNVESLLAGKELNLPLKTN